VTRALLDTSAVMASAHALALEPDDTAAISVLTIGELHGGVRLATNPRARAMRQSRLEAVREAFEPLPVNETIALRYGVVGSFRGRRCEPGSERPRGSDGHRG
jgi:toxin FitB